MLWWRIDRTFQYSIHHWWDICLLSCVFHQLLAVESGPSRKPGTQTRDFCIKLNSKPMTSLLRFKYACGPKTTKPVKFGKVKETLNCIHIITLWRLLVISGVYPRRDQFGQARSHIYCHNEGYHEERDVTWQQQGALKCCYRDYFISYGLRTGCGRRQQDRQAR